MHFKGTTAMHRNAPRRRPGRRGVTLVEMLVTVALVVLIMTIVVNVFRSATGAVRGVQINQEFEVNLRRLEATLRQDLAGATARFTPPLNPKDGLGYFEYGENSFADVQGEDTDDWMALTVKAPIGQPFQGRYWDPNGNQAIQPTIITSEFAEVLYFLRNGNLYRRILLIVPEKSGNLLAADQNSPPSPFPYTVTLKTMYASPSNPLPVSWLGVNDISARPGRWVDLSVAPVPNTLGDLTNRENRAFRPRYDDDYDGDNLPDEFHGGPVSGTNSLPNGILDEYPTLYPNVITSTATATGSVLLNETQFTRVGNPGLDGLPFPYIFPGAYSVPDYPYGATLVYGPIHAVGAATPVVNHSPLELGDNLPVPTANLQTYWGWPTWKETASPFWTDPWIRLYDNGNKQSPGLSNLSTNAAALPPLTTGMLGSSTVPYRAIPQPFNDAAGSSTFALLPTAAAPFTYPSTGQTLLWNNAWEDDLIMTGVRSFDIKAYDPNVIATHTDLQAGDPTPVPHYVDLGYALDRTGAAYWLGGFPNTYTAAQVASGLQSFGHEGRIPPLTADSRVDPQWPTFVDNTGTLQANNIGENSNSTIRLRRVWDSWSTEYTNAPDLPLDPTQGPLNNRPPVYPSYPAPYPAPLRAIQIQIRLSNAPDNDHVKALTITQDFSDKL